MTLKKKIVVIIAASTAISLFAGCSVIDSLTGVERAQNGEVIVRPDGGLGGTIGRVTSSSGGWLGLAGSLLASAVAAYQSYRKKQYVQSITAVVAGVDRAMQGGAKTSVSKEELYAALLSTKNEIMSNPQVLTQIVAGIKAQLRAKEGA